MNNMFFWIIVFGWVIPVGIRMYNRSRMRRLRDLDGPGRGGPRYDGGYGGPGYGPGYGNRYPDYPGQQYPPQPPLIIPGPGEFPPQVPGPAADNPPSSGIAHPAPPASTPASTPAPAEPKGYRARKLAELDAQFSDGKISMEDYIARRQEIMNG